MPDIMQKELGQIDQPFLGYMRPFWWKILVFCPILMYEIDFYAQEESKNAIGNKGEKIREGGYPGKK